MFRLTFTSFRTISRAATCLSHAQRHFVQKSSAQSNENTILSTIPIGNTNKQDKSKCISIRFLCKMNEYDGNHSFVHYIK